MPRCCRAGAAPRRSTAPSWPGDAESRRHHHEDGRGPRHRRDGDGGARADRRRHDRRRSARRPGAARRRSDGARARRRSSAARSRSRRSRTRASPMPSKIAKNETRIDWSKPGKQVHDHIRGLSPFPGAWFELDGARVKALRSTKARARCAPARCSTTSSPSPAARARCGSSQVQRAGKQPMAADEFLRGTPVESRRAGRLTCRATSSPSNMTARRLPAGRSRPTSPPCRASLTAAVEALRGEKTLVQGAGRTDAGVHARGQVAHVDLAKDWDTDTVRDALNAHLRPHPVAILCGRTCRRRFQRAHLGDQAALSLSHHQPPRRSHARCRPRLARAAPARCRGDARGGAAPDRQARLHHVPLDRMPGQVAGEDARPARRRARRRGGPCLAVGALVPAQPGALDGRLAGRWSARANGAPTISRKALDARDRTACGPVAPPDGLYLMQVDY